MWNTLKRFFCNHEWVNSYRSFINQDEECTKCGQCRMYMGPAHGWYYYIYKGK